MADNLSDILLSRSGTDVAWGFRLNGGSTNNLPLSVQRVFSGSPSDGRLQRDDEIVAINGLDVRNWSLGQAQDNIKVATTRLNLTIKRKNPNENVKNTSQSFGNFGQHPNPSTGVSSHSSYAAPTSPPPAPWQDNNYQRSTQPTWSSSAKFVPHSVAAVPWSRPVDNDQADSTPLFGTQQGPSSTYAPHLSNNDFQPNIDSRPYGKPEPVYDQGDEEEDVHLSVRDIKNIFNHGQELPRQFNKTPIRKVMKPRQPQKPTNHAATVEPQPPKNVPVYQQKSSYNPLEFQGVNKPSKMVNRPPGLIQRGAPETMSSAPALPRPAAPAAHTGDPLTDFYLHGLNAKIDAPTLFNSFQSESTGGSRKLLPPRSNEPLIKPIQPLKKKEFNANQSAVLKVLEMEDEPPRSQHQPQHYQQQQQQRYQQPPQQRNVSSRQSGGPRLTDLLQQDEERLAPYKEEPQRRGNQEQATRDEFFKSYQPSQSHQSKQVLHLSHTPVAAPYGGLASYTPPNNYDAMMPCSDF